MFHRLSETFDRFEIDKLEEKQHQNGQYQTSRNRHSRDCSRSHANGQERSSSRQRRSRSRNAHVHSRQTAKKSSIKDRLGTPVKKQQPVRQRMSPAPSTSQHVDVVGGQNFDADETQASEDQINDTDVNHASIDMNDLDSILNKCICKFPWPSANIFCV